MTAPLSEGQAIAALRKCPGLPVGFMERTREKQLEWLCDYADWWKDVREPALPAQCQERFGYGERD